MLITSVDNEKIKGYAKLKEKKYRDQENLFIVEGIHLVLESYKKGLIVEILLEQDEVSLLDVPITYVSREVINKLTTLDTPTNILAICKKREEETNLGNKILLLDRIQDPGNLGTIMRSAAAFGVETVVLGDECVDLYNSKVIRSSQGIQFSINVISRNLVEVIKEIKNMEIPVYGTRLEYGDDISNLRDKDKEKYALVMGNEGQGVAEEVLSLCDKYIYIDMTNNVESLNVGVATSILLYELNRRG